jgi:hypothetical protein
MPACRGGKVFGPGGLAPLPKASDLASNHRRVVAKWNYRAASLGAATARANYLGRDGIGNGHDRPEERQLGEHVVEYLGARPKTGERDPFFDARRARVSRHEVAADLAKGHRIYGLILNPLDSDRRDFDPRRFARDTMRAVERDLGTPLRWYAVVHASNRFDRDDARHVHVVWSSQRTDDPRFQMRIARSYCTQGFQLRASQAVERQLGKMQPHEMEWLRESLAKNAGRYRHLTALRDAGADIHVRRKEGREWCGATYERKPARTSPAREPRVSTLADVGNAMRFYQPRQPSAQSQKWTVYHHLSDHAPDVLRGSRRELIGMVKDDHVSPAAMKDRARDFLLAQGLRERLFDHTVRTALRQFLGHKVIDGPGDQKTRRIGPKNAVKLAERIRANPALLQRQKGVRWTDINGIAAMLKTPQDRLEKRLRGLSPRQARALEAQVERGMVKLDERMEREAAQPTYRQRAPRTPTLMERLNASNARWREKDLTMERGR